MLSTIDSQRLTGSGPLDVCKKKKSEARFLTHIHAIYTPCPRGPFIP